jgi:hypothetical protein
VLGLAVVVRVAVAIAYRPALFYGGDSSQYLKLALTGHPVAIGFERPSGYPFLIDIIFAFGRELAVLTTVQHLAGLLVGILVYALLVRMDVPKWLATVAAAIVLLDSYAIALEQHVLAEAFFTLALVASVFLVLAQREPSTLAIGAGGLLLGASATMRGAALFAVPVWLLYVFWARFGWRALAAAGLGLALPVITYATWNAEQTGRFGIVGADGWFLYARVAEIGSCTGVDVPAAGRALCRRTARDSREGAAFHLWSPEGSAHRAFGRLTGDPERKQRLNAIMRDHALAIIRARPLTYAGMVASDFLRYFEPGVESRYVSDSALSLPASGALMQLDPRVKRSFFPEVESRVHEPAGLVRTYHRVVHTPRWLLGCLIVLVTFGLLLPVFTRGRMRMPHWREILLLTGTSIAILIGATATSEFVLRYLVPVAPLILAGGVAASVDVARLLRPRAGDARNAETPQAMRLSPRRGTPAGRTGSAAR